MRSKLVEEIINQLKSGNEVHFTPGFFGKMDITLVNNELNAQTQSTLPIDDHHSYDDRIIDCIKFMENKLKEKL